MARRETLRIFQKGWNFRQDGPGNRLVWHLQGCNLRCPWCSNPEGLDPQGRLLVHAEKLCEAVCPWGAIRGTRVDRARCAACVDRACTGRNRNLGIRLSCKEFTVEELVAEALTAKALFHSGGGVTLTGGEPTVQFEAVRTLLETLRAEGIDTALETNGTHPDLPLLFPFLDTLILDLKHHDSARMKASTGVGNEVVLENLRAAVSGVSGLTPGAGRAASPVPLPVWLRITRVPGFNDGPDAPGAFQRLLSGLPRERLSVELLDFHEWGKTKWEQAGLGYAFRLPAGMVKGGSEHRWREALAQTGVTLIET